MRVPLSVGLVFTLLYGALPLCAQTEREYQHGFRFFQNSAPEFLQIEVLEVSLEPIEGLFGGGKTKVKASARVVDVIRSDSGMTNGQVIDIVYDHDAKAGNSAETPIILEKGKSYPAFLKRNGKNFSPIARHLSFSPPSGIQMKVYEEARTRSKEKALQAANPPAAPTKRILVVEPSPVRSTPAAPVVVAPEPTPAPQAPQPPTAVVAEIAPTEPVKIAPEPTPSQPTKKTRQTKARITSSKTDSEFPPANVESQPLPQSNPNESVESTPPAPAALAAPVVEEPAPIKAKPPTRKVAENTTPPPKPTTPQPNPRPETKPQEESLPNITSIETPELPPVDRSATSSPRPSSADGTAARNGYAEIYGLIKEGETVQIEGKNEKAREFYTQARDKLLILKAEQPKFQPFMVQYRLRDLEKKLNAINEPVKAPAGAAAKP